MSYKEKATQLMAMYDNLTEEEGNNPLEELCKAGEEVVKINKHQLNEEMESHAAVYTYFHGLMALAKTDLDLAHFEHEQFEARERTNTINSSRVKLTVTALDSVVKSNPNYPTYIKKVIFAEKKYIMLKGLVNGLAQKKDLLVQLSSNNRAETKLYT